MITKDNYSEEHIRELQSGTRRDPVIIERALFAFGLLEALAQVGMEFTFKGGTSLILLLSKPKRLSTDIDIVVKPGTDVDEYIRRASIIFPFKDGGEQFRKKRAIWKSDISSFSMTHQCMGESLSIFFWIFFLKKTIMRKSLREKYQVSSF